jgi:hypothetical protein
VGVQEEVTGLSSQNKENAVRALLLSLLLAGCAVQGNVARTLNPVPAEGLNPSSPAYAAIDKYSFSTAVLQYPTGNKTYHRVPVGDYMVAKLSNTDAKFDALALRKLDAKCEASGGFNPSALCVASYAVDVDRNGERKVISGKVDEMKLKGVYLPDQQIMLSTARFPDDPILAQARTVIDAVLADMTTKLK